MISDIKKSIENNVLTVEVTCKIRNFAVQEIKLLTTEKLIDMLNNEYKIIKTLESPKHKVGNTTKKQTQQTGRWVFELESKQVKDKPAPPKKKTSIRNRMSKIIQEQKEENID